MYLAEATRLSKATLFGHRGTLFSPPPVRLFAQPTHARETSRQHPAGDVDAYAHTHAHSDELWGPQYVPLSLSLIHISEPTRLGMISYAVFCLKKKK